MTPRTDHHGKGWTVKEQLEQLIQNLTEGDADDKQSAAHALIALDRAAVGLLWPLLNDEQPAVRLSAIDILCEIGPPAAPALPQLERLLNDADTDVVRQARTAIFSIDPQYLTARSRKRHGRLATIVAVMVLLVIAAVVFNLPARINNLVGGDAYFDGQHVDVWTEQLDRTHEQSLIAAARLEAGGGDALPVLTAIAGDKSANLDARRKAIELIGKQKTKEATKVLMALLNDPDWSLSRSKDRTIRIQIIEALDACGETAMPAVSVLRKALAAPMSAYGLERYKTVSTLSDLVEYRRALASALLSIDDNKSMPAISSRFVGHDIYAPPKRWYTLSYTKDSQRLTTLRGDGSLRGATIVSWSLNNRHDSDYFQPFDGVGACAIHPDGIRAAVADVVGNITLYRVGNRERLSVMGAMPNQGKVMRLSANLRPMAYNSDGNTLAIIRGNVLKVYDVRQSPYGHDDIDTPPTGRPLSVLFSNDGRTLAVLDTSRFAGSTQNPRGTWWVYGLNADADQRTWQLRQRLADSGPFDEISVLSQDGKLMAVNAGSAEMQVHIRDTQTGKLVTTCQSKSTLSGATSLQFIERDKLAAGHRSGEITIWNARSGERLSDLDWHLTEVQALAVSPNGNELASADKHGWVRLWDLESNED